MPEDVGSVILGGAIGLTSALLISLFNDWRANKRLERQIENSNERLDKQLERSENNMKMQLLHADQKALLDELYALNRGGKFDPLNEVINGFRGVLLPEEFKRDIRKAYESYQQRTEENNPHPEPRSEDLITEEELADMKEQARLRHDKLDPMERYEINLKDKENQLKNSMEHIISKAMKKEY